MKWKISALMAVASFAAPAAHAATADGILAVTMDVTPGCSLSSTSGSGGGGNAADALLDFGSVTGESTGSKDATAVSTTSGTPGGSVVEVVCSNSYTGVNSPTVTMNLGLNPTGTQRQMAGPAGAFVAYDIYEDAGYNTKYTDTAVALNIPTAGVSVPVYVYGRVPDVSGLADGTYSDTVTVTLTY